MFEHTDADLIQVFEETVEDGYQVCCSQLVSQDNRQFVDGERQRTPHFPLETSKGHRKEHVQRVKITVMISLVALPYPANPSYLQDTHQSPRFSAYLDISRQGFVRVLEAVPVLSSQSERHPRQAEGTVFGDLCVDCLSPRRVRH